MSQANDFSAQLTGGVGGLRKGCEPFLRRRICVQIVNARRRSMLSRYVNASWESFALWRQFRGRICARAAVGLLLEFTLFGAVTLPVLTISRKLRTSSDRIQF